MMMKRLLFILLVMLWGDFAIADEMTPTPEIYVQEGEYEYVVEGVGEGPVLPVDPTVNLNMTLTDENLILDPYVENAQDDYSIYSAFADGVPVYYPFIFPRYNYEYVFFFQIVFLENGYEPGMYEGLFIYEKDIIVPAMEGDPHDVDFNGKVNIDDVTALIHYLLSNDSQGISLG